MKQTPVEAGMEHKIIEKLSDLEHQQWEHWTKELSIELQQIEGFIGAGVGISAIRVISSRIDKWDKCWKPYNELEEHIKEFDRVWARKVYDVFNEALVKTERETVELVLKDVEYYLGSTYFSRKDFEAIKKKHLEGEK